MLLTVRTTKPLEAKQEELALVHWEDILFKSAGVLPPGGPAYALEIGEIIESNRHHREFIGKIKSELAANP